MQKLGIYFHCFVVLHRRDSRRDNNHILWPPLYWTAAKKVWSPRAFSCPAPKPSISPFNENITEFHMYSGMVGLLSYRESSNSFSVGHYRLQMGKEKQDPRGQDTVDFGTLCFFPGAEDWGEAVSWKKKKIKRQQQKKFQQKPYQTSTKFIVLLNVSCLCVNVTQYWTCKIQVSSQEFFLHLSKHPLVDPSHW